MIELIVYLHREAFSLLEVLWSPLAVLYHDEERTAVLESRQVITNISNFSDWKEFVNIKGPARQSNE